MHYLWLTLLESIEAICNCCCATLNCAPPWDGPSSSPPLVLRRQALRRPRVDGSSNIWIITYTFSTVCGWLYDCTQFCKVTFGGIQWFLRMSYTQVMNQSVALNQLTSIFVIWRWVERCIQNVVRMTENDVITQCSSVAFHQLKVLPTFWSLWESHNRQVMAQMSSL